MSELDDVEEEVKHMKKVLTRNGYQKWSFQIPKKKVMEKDNETDGPTANKHPVFIPYISGLSEQLQRVGWFTVLSVVSVIKSTLVRQPGCWTPGSVNTQMGNTPTPSSRNTPLPPVIATHWMTLRSW